MSEQKTNWDKVKIGALWERRAKKSGNKYLSGVIEINGAKHKLLIFPSRKDQSNENAPDFNIYDNNDSPSSTQSPVKPNYTKKAPKPVQPEVEVETGGAETSDLL